MSPIPKEKNVYRKSIKLSDTVKSESRPKP